MKQSPVDLRRRSPVEWGVRLLLAGVAAAVGCFAVAQSLAEVLPDREIELAHRLAPNNARVTAKLTRLRIVANPELARQPETQRLAREALRGDATAVSAVTTLGFVAETQGDIGEARRLFVYSDRLTRRDLLARLWLIEDAVRRGEAGEALHQYDIALRTNRAASGFLFPVLASASSDPTIATALVKTFAAQPIWAEAFISFLPNNSEDPEATARLFVALRRANIPVSQWAQVALTDALIAAKRYDPAWAYYTTVREGVDRRRSRDPGFTAVIEQPSQFDWVPANSATGISAAIQSSPGGGLLDFAVPTGIGGQVLRQLQLLPPGKYLLEGHSIGIDQQRDSRPYWRLTCATDARELGRVIVPNSAEGDGQFAGHFTVPAGCSAQYLELVAPASDAVAGLTGQFDRVELRSTE